MFCIYCRCEFDEKKVDFCGGCGKRLYKADKSRINLDATVAVKPSNVPDVDLDATIVAKPGKPDKPAAAPAPEPAQEPKPQPEAPVTSVMFEFCQPCGMEFPVTCTFCGAPVPADTLKLPMDMLPCPACKKSFKALCPQCKVGEMPAQPVFTSPGKGDKS